MDRAIGNIKNLYIWQRVVPLSLFGAVNQIWSVCAFLSNIQDLLISMTNIVINCSHLKFP